MALRPAGPEASAAVGSTDAARERRQGVEEPGPLGLRTSGGECGCAPWRLRRRPLHPRARNSWAQSTPFLQPQLTRQFLREDHVDPGDGRPLRCLAPTRGRGAHARLGRGGGSGASGEDPGELFLHPSPLVPSPGLRDGQVPPCLRFSPQPRNLLPPGSPRPYPHFSSCPGAPPTIPTRDSPHLPAPNPSAQFRSVSSLWLVFSRLFSSCRLLTSPLLVGFSGSPAGLAFEHPHTSQFLPQV